MRQSVVLEEEALYGTTDRAALVPEAALRHPDPVRLDRGRRLETDPFPGRHAVEVDRQIRVDEAVAREPRQDPADAVPEVRGGGDARERRDRLAGDERHAEADPVGRRARPVESAGDEAVLDRVAVEGGSCERVAP